MFKNQLHLSFHIERALASPFLSLTHISAHTYFYTCPSIHIHPSIDVKVNDLVPQTVGYNLVVRVLSIDLVVDRSRVDGSEIRYVYEQEGREGD